MRIVKSMDDFFDLSDKVGNNWWVTMEYVTAANITPPQVRKRNPATNRMKNFDDFSVFRREGDDEVGALVTLTKYNFRYQHRNTVNKGYNDYVSRFNTLRGEYGLPPVERRKDYKEKMNWGKEGLDMYGGNKEELKGHVYYPQNMYGAKILGKKTYAISTSGNIIREMPEDEIVPYLKAKRETSGVGALRKMQADEAKIQEYIKKEADLKFRYKALEANSILSLVATSVENGYTEKVAFINPAIGKAVNGIQIDKAEFEKIAREGRNDLDESRRRRNIIRITESDVRRMVNETVRMLTEVIADGSDLHTYKQVCDAVYDYMELHWPGDLDQGKTHYKAALKGLGFYPDGYDQYGANTYSNGKVRVAVFYDRGEGYWDMEEASGSSDTTDDFYNTSSEMRDEYGNYGRGSLEDPWNR